MGYQLQVLRRRLCRSDDAVTSLKRVEVDDTISA